MSKYGIKPGQIWKSRKGNFQLLIFREKGGKWKCKTLTTKPGVYGDTHTMSEFTLKKQYEIHN